MTITKRVTATPAGGATKRVGSFAGSSYSAWGDSWGDSWGESWRVLFPLSDVGLTQRISETPETNITKRVSGI